MIFMVILTHLYGFEFLKLYGFEFLKLYGFEFLKLYGFQDLKKIGIVLMCKNKNCKVLKCKKRELYGFDV